MENELSSQSRTLLTPEEYLRIERPALRKSEFLNGEMMEMPGVSREHTLIVTNLVATLGNQSVDRPFEVYSSDMRVKVSSTGLYTLRF
jgi:Uma2 family endonuclease